MNQRQEDIFSFGVAYLKPRFCENEKKILQDFNKNRNKIVSQLQGVCQQLFEKAAQSQSAFQYMCICPLQSGIIAKTYDVQFSLHDATCFADQNSYMAYWNADFLYHYLEEDIEEFAKEVRKRVIRVLAGEIQEFRLDYACNYHMLLQEFLAAHISDIESAAGFTRINKEEKFQIMFGRYMAAVSPLRREELKR